MFPVNLNGDDEFGDHDVVLIETTGAGQAPEWEGEMDMVAALEAQFLDLQYLLQDMHSTKGMNQQLAMEAHRLIPEMAEKYPLGYFTKTTTGTLYKPALEELHAGVWALIGAAALAISAMIYKFVRWVIKKWNGTDVGSDDEGRPSDAEINSAIKTATEAAEKKVEQNNEVVEQLDHLSPTLHEATEQIAVEVKKQHSATKPVAPEKAASSDEPMTSQSFDSFEDVAFMLHERHNTGSQFKALQDLSDNSFYDILEEGRWSKLMMSLSPIISSIEQQIVQRVQVLESIFSVTQTEGDPVRHKNAMNLIAQVKEPIKLPGTEYHDLQALARALDKPQNLMSFNAGKERFNPVKSTDRLRQIMGSSSYKSLLQVRVKFIEKLATLNAQQVKLGEIANKWNAPHPGQGVGVGVPEDISHAMGPVLSNLRREVTYLMMVNTEVERYVDAVERLNATVANWWSSTFTLIGHYASQTKVPEGAPKIEMPVSVQKAQGILQILRRSMGKLPGSDLGKNLKGAVSKVAAKATQAMANAAPAQAGHVHHPEGAVAPGFGARNIPEKAWQGGKGKVPVQKR